MVLVPSNFKKCHLETKMEAHNQNIPLIGTIVKKSDYSLIYSFKISSDYL